MRRALHVGADQGPALTHHHGAMANDAKALQAFFEANYAFLPSVPLVDAAATRDSVLDALTHLVSDTRGGDQVLITLAAHGSSDPAQGESITLVNGALTESEVMTALTPLRTMNVAITLIVDACNSDGFGAIEKLLPIAVARFIRRTMRRLNHSRRGAFDGGDVARRHAPVSGDQWRIYLIAAAGKTEFAFADCGTKAVPRGCLSLAIEQSAKGNGQTVAALGAAITRWMSVRHDDQHPTFNPAGAASGTDPFLADPQPPELP